MKQTFINILSVSLIALCLACEPKSQTRAPDTTTTPPQRSSSPKLDLSNWQTVRLEEKGIKFKLPPDWHQDDSDLKSEKEHFTVEAWEWNTQTGGMISLFITTHHKGFVSLIGKAASSEERVEEKLQSVKKSTKDDSLIGEVKKLKVSGVEGVYRVMNPNFKQENGDTRCAILWTGYRIHRGEGQEIDISLDAFATSEEILRSIFSTIEFE
jgi:hypothetical protein